MALFVGESNDCTKDLVMQLWNEWTKKISPQREVVSVDVRPKQDSITSNPLKSGSSIESHLNGEGESSVVTQKNHVVIEVDDKISIINSSILDQEENCAATIPLTVYDLSSTDSSEDANEREIQEGGEDDDASVKSDSSTSSAGSVWVMEDMVKLEAVSS